MEYLFIIYLSAINSSVVSRYMIVH